MLKKFLFADLDDTLFQTLEKCAVREALEPNAIGRIENHPEAERLYLAIQDGDLRGAGRRHRRHDSTRVRKVLCRSGR